MKVSRTSAYVSGGQGCVVELRSQSRQVDAALEIRGMLYGQVRDFGLPDESALPGNYLTC